MTYFVYSSFFVPTQHTTRVGTVGHAVNSSLFAPTNPTQAAFPGTRQAFFVPFFVLISYPNAASTTDAQRRESRSSNHSRAHPIGALRPTQPATRAPPVTTTTNTKRPRCRPPSTAPRPTLPAGQTRKAPR